MGLQCVKSMNMIPLNKVILESCVQGYAFKNDYMRYILYRITQAIKACFFCSDWQKAETLFNPKNMNALIFIFKNFEPLHPHIERVKFICQKFKECHPIVLDLSFNEAYSLVSNSNSTHDNFRKVYLTMLKIQQQYILAIGSRDHDYKKLDDQQHRLFASLSPSLKTEFEKSEKSADERFVALFLEMFKKEAPQGEKPMSFSATLLSGLVAAEEAHYRGQA